MKKPDFSSFTRLPLGKKIQFIGQVFFWIFISFTLFLATLAAL